MQRAWIPNLCYFPEPADEYDPFVNRIWYLDDKLEIEADVDALQAGDVPRAYVADFHQEHCTYNWRKLAIAVNQKKTYVDNPVGSIDHATHCAQGLAEQTKIVSACTPRGPGTFTMSNLNFLKCVRLR
jgi:hypothetical protein